MHPTTSRTARVSVTLCPSSTEWRFQMMLTTDVGLEREHLIPWYRDVMDTGLKGGSQGENDWPDANQCALHT